MIRHYIKNYIIRLGKKWWKASSIFFKIMIPISILIKVLEETNLMPIIGMVFEPLMYPLGLPGEMSLVWVTAMVSNIYGGLLALSSIYTNSPLNIAQITTLATLILFAHTFLIEIPICKKAGVKILPTFIIRFFGGYIFAILINLFYTLTNTQQAMVELPLFTTQTLGLGDWAIEEVRKYISISLIVLGLIILLDIFEKIRLIELINNALYPIIKFLGISKKVMPLTIIGMTLGLAYGGGLIIAESKEKDIPKKDIFMSIALLSLFHSIIEDSFLMIAIGADWVGVFVLRFIYTLGVMLLIKKLIEIIPLKYLVD